MDREVEGSSAGTERGAFSRPPGVSMELNPRPVQAGTGPRLWSPRLQRVRRWGMHPGARNELALFEGPLRLLFNYII